MNCEARQPERYESNAWRPAASMIYGVGSGAIKLAVAYEKITFASLDFIQEMPGQR